MKRFRRMDKVERYITLKSIKIAYAYTVIFLVIWCIIEYILHRSTSNIVFFLFITQNLVLIFSQSYFKKKTSDN